MVAFAPVRVVIFADDPLARAGLASSLDETDQIEVIAQFPLSELEEQTYRNIGEDLLLIDEGWGDEMLESDHLQFPEGTRILRLIDPSYFGRLPMVPEHGLISREANAEDLIRAIHAVDAGWIVLDPLASVKRPIPVQEVFNALTDREQEVIELVAEGLTNRAISVELEISENTVKYHINAIFKKLGVQSRTEAVLLAVRSGLIPL